jgi:hypothetical protein
MAWAFTTYWARDRYVAARRLAPPDFRFDLLFGGPHISMPSFSRAGVMPGDWIYPVHVQGGALHVLGRMRVARVIPIAEFRAMFPERAAGLGRFDLAVGGEPARDGPRAALAYLAPTCVNEAVIGELGTPLLPNLVLPPERVEQLRYVSQRGERDVKKHLREGRVVSLGGFQGNFRLSMESAEVLARLVEAAVAGVVPSGGSVEPGSAWSEVPDWE